MAIPSIYINLEDDVSKITDRLRHNSAKQVILVCPKRSYLFSDSINLRLLKKQTDLLRKEIFILTMDEKGQLYAREAGFALKFLPKVSGRTPLSDIKTPHRVQPVSVTQDMEEEVVEVQSDQQLSKKPFVEKVVAPSIVSSVFNIKEDPDIKLEINDNIFPEGESLEEEVKKSRPKIVKVIMFTATFSVVLLLALAFVVLPKATVVVYPKTEVVTRDMTISMSKNVQAIDPSKLVMPAIPVKETVSLNKKFESQGKFQVGNKAEGVVRIYNFTGLPINLKAETTTLTLNGKSYKLINDISGLKPTTYSNSKTKEINPASLADPVEVIAAEGGTDYNAPLGSRMEITNQVFGSRPQLLYANTESELAGGTTRYLSVISKDDIEKAKKTLEEEALAQVRDRLSTAGSVLADRAFSFNVTEYVVNNPEGTQTPSFEASLKGDLVGLSFKKQDLDDLILQRISQTISGNKVLSKGPNTQITYTVSALDSVNQLASLQVHYQGEAAYVMDLGNLAPQLVGKNQNEVNEILRSKAEIDKVEITLAPSWQKNFPLFVNKIYLSVYNP